MSPKTTSWLSGVKVYSDRETFKWTNIQHSTAYERCREPKQCLHAGNNPKSVYTVPETQHMADNVYPCSPFQVPCMIILQGTSWWSGGRVSCIIILQGTSWWPGDVLHDDLAGNVFMAWWCLAWSSCRERLDGLVVGCLAWWSCRERFAGLVVGCLAWWSF